MFVTRPLARLIEAFQKFPGVGPKSAQRMAFFLLSMSNEAVQDLLVAIAEAKEKIHHCSRCYHLSAEDPCEICSNQKRDRHTICVVAEAKDVIALERTHQYKGTYHVLNGLISPLEGKGPNELTARELIHRVGKGDIKEVILAINPTVEGDTTVLYLGNLLKPLGTLVSRIAFGLPAGSDLEYADDLTLSKALEGRREI